MVILQSERLDSKPVVSHKSKSSVGTPANDKTLPKALRTQALTALTSNFGLVGLVWQVWFGRFGLVGMVW